MVVVDMPVFEFWLPIAKLLLVSVYNDVCNFIAPIFQILVSPNGPI
jgi:hypothetical protein